MTLKQPALAEVFSRERGLAFSSFAQPRRLLLSAPSSRAYLGRLDTAQRAVQARVRAAILCSTKATADTPEAKRARDIMAAKAEREGPGAIAAELVPKLLARVTLERQPAVVREVTTMIERQPVYGMIVTLRALRDRPDSTPLLGQIRIPILVVAGDDDQIAPAEGMEEMARAIPGAQFTVIPGSGHLSPLEQPQLVNDAVNAFLAQL